MAITRVQARKLCNAAELELVVQSTGDALKSLTPAQLRNKVKRSRTLRSKFADLYQRQSVAIQAGTGNKRGNSDEANARTQLKMQLFDEVLKRFETRLAQLDAKAERDAAASAKAKARAAARSAREARPKAEPAAPKKSRARQAAGQAAPAKKTRRVSVKAAVKAALAANGGSPAAAPAREPSSPKAPAVKRATQVPSVVAVRGKQIGAHARSAQARSQAKRDAR